MKRRDALQRVAIMMGGAISAPALIAMLEGCKSGAEQAATTTNSGFSLSSDYKTLVADIAEVIIPKTDTPGAKEAGVGPFIEKMLADCYPAEQQQHFVKGLDALVEEAKKAGGGFATLKPEQQIAVLKTMQAAGEAERKVNEEAEKKRLDEAANNLKKGKIVDSETGLEKRDVKAPAKPIPFFQLMKDLTTFGYFTSEVGCKQALAYDPIPGQYIGCMKLEPNQKPWAL